MEKKHKSKFLMIIGIAIASVILVFLINSYFEEDYFKYTNSEVGFECMLPSGWSEWESTTAFGGNPNVSYVALDNNVDPKWGDRAYILLSKTVGLESEEFMDHLIYEVKEVVIDDIPSEFIVHRYKEDNQILSRRVLFEREGYYWKIIYSNSASDEEETDTTFDVFLESFHFIPVSE